MVVTTLLSASQRWQDQRTEGRQDTYQGTDLSNGHCIFSRPLIWCALVCGFFFKLFIYSFLAALSLCHFTQVFSSYGGYSLEWGLLFFAVCWLLIHRSCFSCCGELWHRGIFAPRHMGFSQTRYQTHILYIGSRFLTTEPPERSPNCGSYYIKSQALCSAFPVILRDSQYPFN